MNSQGERSDQDQAATFIEESQGGLVLGEEERWTICATCSKVVEIEDEDACDCCFTGAQPRRIEVVAALPQPVLSEREAKLEAVADTLEEWGADNESASDREGDVANERYKAFQMSADLIRAALSDQEADRGE